ncbi:unnamed protein product [Urochloa decumbens]|uniref:F-box domain-containing protein n=1 Tax=Urochloa decumbens TaxID=240449 RepID=A0ABC8ZZA4_9POAL
MDAKMQQQSSPSPPATAIPEVLDDDNLLEQILIRLIFPTGLVRAALVCRRWLHVASEPAFLRRYINLHPPRLLGFYAQHGLLAVPKFVQMPDTPPELAAAVRRASSALYDTRVSGRFVMVKSISSCLDGRLLVRLYGYDHIHAVLSPLHPGRDAIVLPRPPQSTNAMDGGATCILHRCLPDGCVVTCAARWCWWDQSQWTMRIDELQDDCAWQNLASPPVIYRPAPIVDFVHILPMNDGKIFLVSSASTAAAMCSASSALGPIALPDVLDLDCCWSTTTRNYMIVPVVDDRSIARFCLMYVKDLQIHIWVYHLNGGEWVLDDTICLRKICANSGVAISDFQDGLTTTGAMVHAIGQGAKFVFVQVGHDVLYVHIESRVVKKVYSLVPGDGNLTKLTPFMMIDSPVFPVNQKEVST